MSNSDTIANVLMFQQLKNELAPEVSAEIFQIDAEREAQTMDVVVVVQRKRDKAYISLRFHPIEIHKWNPNSQINFNLTDEQRALLILFLQ